MQITQTYNLHIFFIKIVTECRAINIFSIWFSTLRSTRFLRISQIFKKIIFSVMTKTAYIALCNMTRSAGCYLALLFVLDCDYCVLCVIANRRRRCGNPVLLLAELTSEDDCSCAGSCESCSGDTEEIYHSCFIHVKVFNASSFVIRTKFSVDA